MLRAKSRLILISLLCLSFFSSFTLVSAKEIYFTNDNGVSLTKEEYDFLTKMYWDGYQKIMTKEEYQKFDDNNIMDREYEEKVVTYNDTPLTRGTFHQSLAKSIKISRSCDSNNCAISVVLTWLGVPKVKSYDVMGCSFDNGLQLITTPHTRVSSSDKTYFSDDLQVTEKKGFGSSFKIPTGTGLIINQDFYVSRNGHVYASYQHAMSETTLAISRDYKISGIGFGGVFEFGEKASKIYDDMNGVDIAV